MSNFKKKNLQLTPITAFYYIHVYPYIFNPLTNYLAVAVVSSRDYMPVSIVSLIINSKF